MAYFQGKAFARFGWDERDEVVLFEYNNGDWLTELLGLLTESRDNS